MSGEFDFLSQYYIYLYILYIYIYTHTKFCISHQERKSFGLLFFDCKLYILGESDGGGKRIKKGDSQMSKGKGGSGDETQ